MTGNRNYFQKRSMGFKYAFNGIWQVLKNEPNFRIHFFAAITVILIGLFFSISNYEWLVICLAIGSVLCAEIFNSAIEKIVDLIHPEPNKKAGIIKDISAGAVLVIAITAAVIGLLVFIPKLIDLL